MLFGNLRLTLNVVWGRMRSVCAGIVGSRRCLTPPPAAQSPSAIPESFWAQVSWARICRRLSSSSVGTAARPCGWDWPGGWLAMTAAALAAARCSSCFYHEVLRTLRFLRFERKVKSKQHTPPALISRLRQPTNDLKSRFLQQLKSSFRQPLKSRFRQPTNDRSRPRAPQSQPSPERLPAGPATQGPSRAARVRLPEICPGPFWRKAVWDFGQDSGSAPRVCCRDDR